MQPASAIAMPAAEQCVTAPASHSKADAMALEAACRSSRISTQAGPNADTAVRTSAQTGEAP